MTIQQRFILTFTGFTLAVICVSSAVGMVFLKNTFHLFTTARNTEYISIMADQIYMKALIGFLLIILLVSIISIPLGIMLSKQLADPYLKIFRSLKDIACNRLSIKTHGGLKRSEYEILNKYITLLMEDFEKIKEYEKVKSWKDGARMLMHELRNPLTPLKISAQQLAVSSQVNDLLLKDVNRINNAVSDIEKILSMFKDLGNIEFGQKVRVNLKSFVTELECRLENSDLCRPFQISFTNDSCFVHTEPVLLRMCIVNLIRNGIEENPEGFYVNIQENSANVAINFITPGAKIPESNRLFRPGYSSKGDKRGFGLFLCKMISDYLNLDLFFENTSTGVRFSLSLLKTDPAEIAALKHKNEFAVYN